MPEVVAELRRMADDLEGKELETKRGSPRISKVEGAAYLRIFKAWQRACDHPRAKPTQALDRRRKVLARLREGYSEQDILAAIEGCALSPHHMGSNDEQTTYNDLELICRSGSKLEKFRRIYEEHGGGEVADPDEDPRIAKKMGEAQEALAEGRIADYERLIAEIDTLRGRE